MSSSWQIPHEWPGILRPNGLLTTYSACDTTSLYVIAAYATKVRVMARARGRRASLGDLANAAALTTVLPFIQRAVEYLVAHVDSRGLFVEDPGGYNSCAPPMLLRRL